MPRKLSESVTGGAELIFPDDATGRQYRLRELAVYGAEEVRDEIGDETVPKFGDWLPVELKNESEAWLNAPAELRQVLIDRELETGDWFEITELDKPGHRQSDPYRVTIQVTETSEQERLQ